MRDFRKLASPIPCLQSLLVGKKMSSQLQILLIVYARYRYFRLFFVCRRHFHAHYVQSHGYEARAHGRRAFDNIAIAIAKTRLIEFYEPLL